MEEDIKIIEKMLDRYDVDKLKEYGFAEEILKEYYAIQNLISRYKELEKHYQHEQEYINGEVFSAKQMHYIEDNYIDKSKIKEKIDSLKKIEETMEKLFPEGTVNSWVIKGQIDILQDLLEESE